MIMSSVFAHSLVGAAIYTRVGKLNSLRGIFSCAFVSFLAIIPDLDYVIYWLFDYRLDPRYTHSIFYCLIISAVVSLIKLTIFKNALASIPYYLLWISPLTHLALDLLVGVYPMPLYWPANSDLMVLPFGILPSAGKLNIFNYYFWRNLVIELGILLPIVGLFVPALNKHLVKDKLSLKVLWLLIFCGFVFMGANLTR
ncbi:MAG: metal-dependent hydrolase [Spirulinaceae cyanobacterium]